MNGKSPTIFLNIYIYILRALRYMIASIYYVGECLHIADDNATYDIIIISSHVVGSKFS
jgi:hypothetical protein